MLKTGKQLYLGFNKTKVFLCAFSALLYLLLLQLSGASIAEFVWLAFILSFYLVLPGLFFTKLLKPSLPISNFKGPLAILFGSGFLAVLYCFTMRLQLIWLLRCLPVIISCIYIAISVLQKSSASSPRRSILSPAPRPHQWVLLLLFFGLLLLYSFTSVIKNAHPAIVGDVLLNQDLLWNVGNANSFKLAFPPQDIRFYNVRLHYHYLTELLTGTLSLLSGISAYNIDAFYLQPFMLAALVLCLFSFARQLWPTSQLKPLLFTISHFVLGCASVWFILPNGASLFRNDYITHLITNINSLATALIFLSIFCGLWLYAARQKHQVHLLYYPVLAASFLMLCFSKGPLAAIVAISILITTIITFFQKRASIKGILCALCLIALFGVVYVTMFSSGANSSMPISIFGSLEKGGLAGLLIIVPRDNIPIRLLEAMLFWLIQSFLMCPAQFPLYIADLFQSLRRFSAVPPEKLLAHGVVAGGLLAFFLFDHPSMSQAYFLYGAVFFINLIAIDNIPIFAELFKKQSKSLVSIKRKLFVSIAAFCAAIAIVTTGFLYVNLVGSGARQFARNTGLVEKYPYEAVVTADDENAMLWLAANSPPSAMFATNRIHTGSWHNGISNLYSAFCGRQGYMEGYQYAFTNMGVSHEVIDARIALNETLFSPKTPAHEVVALCKQNNISYLIFSTQFEGSVSQLSEMELVYSSSMVKIYKIPDL